MITLEWSVDGIPDTAYVHSVKECVPVIKRALRKHPALSLEDIAIYQIKKTYDPFAIMGMVKNG